MGEATWSAGGIGNGPKGRSRINKKKTGFPWCMAHLLSFERHEKSGSDFVHDSSSKISNRPIEVGDNVDDTVDFVQFLVN